MRAFWGGVQRNTATAMALHSSRRLVLLDPGLNSAVGHHADLNAALTPALLAQGWDVEIWADAQAAVDPRLVEQLPGLRPLLQNAGYIDPRHWCDLSGSLHQAALLRPQLADAAGGGAVQAWLAHSLLPFQLIALAQLLQHQPPATVLISLMFAPGEVFGGQSGLSLADQRLAAELNARTAIAALARSARQAGHRLILAAASQTLIERYTPLCAAADLPAPLLHPSPLGGVELSFRGVAPGSPQVLLHWGERKPDKGRELALAVLEQLLSDAPLPEALQQVHWCFHASSREPPGAAEQTLLQRAACHPRISVLEGSQSRERMLQELARSSAALLAYSSVAYAERSSGVFWLYVAVRLACGLPAPLVTPRHGWLWREGQAFGVPCVALPEPAMAAEVLERLAEVLRLSATAPALTPYGHSVVGQPWDRWVVDQLEADRVG
jgi:hypothetical protein